MFRLLVTGSRDWSDAQVITRELEIVQAHEGEQVVLVSGNCRGADMIAEEVAVKFGWMIERHPCSANWHAKTG
jgi:predicted Rossmann fold nucleotide-binding protein DprA/Smf involved in DNA uptake